MISVVIPCLNEVEFIDATLESLLRQEPPGVDWEVIVADVLRKAMSRILICCHVLATLSTRLAQQTDVGYFDAFVADVQICLPNSCFIHPKQTAKLRKME